MPPIPFNTGQASGLEQLAGAPPLVINQVVDAAGTVRSRPGLSAWSRFPTAIPNASAVEMILPWGDYVLYSTADRSLWVVRPNGIVSALSDGTAATLLDDTTPTRPVGVATRLRAVIATGGALQKWEGAGLSARLGGSPPNCTHVANVAQRLIVNTNDQSGRLQWSGLGEIAGHESWDALDYAEAEAKSDPLAAVADNANEAFAFGTRTLQVFSPDPYTGFAAGRAVNVGLLAPYSLVAVDDSFLFLDRERRFVSTDGRGSSTISKGFTEENVVSGPIESELRAMTGSNVWGFRMRLDRWDCAVWFFPTDGKGWIFNARGNQWSEWRAWGATGYTAPNITAAVSWPEQNLVLVGLATGQIVKLDVTAHTDMGGVIKLQNRSGFVSHGTSARKQNKAVRFLFKRGATASGTAPPVHVSWRDDLGAFRDPVVRDLGLAGDYNPVIELRSTGVYRHRQWEVTYTSDADFTFVGAEEDFAVLGN